MKRVCPPVLLVAFASAVALASCKSSEERARDILDEHETRFVECLRILNGVESGLGASLDATARGSTGAARKTMDDVHRAMDEFEQCRNAVLTDIEAGRESADIPESLFAEVFATWALEMKVQAAKPHKP